jgi:hypothetical protein
MIHNYMETITNVRRWFRVQHAHICQTSGDSVRLSQAMAGKGVVALNERPGATTTGRSTTGTCSGGHNAARATTGWPRTGR